MGCCATLASPRVSGVAGAGSTTHRIHATTRANSLAGVRSSLTNGPGHDPVSPRLFESARLSFGPRRLGGLGFLGWCFLGHRDARYGESTRLRKNWIFFVTRSGSDCRKSLSYFVQHWRGVKNLTLGLRARAKP